MAYGRGGRTADPGAADRAGWLDEFKLRGAGLPGFSDLPGSWAPDMDFDEAFVMWRGLGVNYEYGVLEHPARTAIHVTHRIGALITFLFLGWLVIAILRAGGPWSGPHCWSAALLLLQVGLGIGNVPLHLPLTVATAHNGVAALLLVSLIYLNYRLWRQPY